MRIIKERFLIWVVIVMTFFCTACGVQKTLEKAEEAYEVDEFEEAIGYYKDVLDKDEDNRDAYEGIIKSYVALGNRSKAEKYYKKAEEKLDKSDLETLKKYVEDKEIQLSRTSVKINSGEEVTINVENYKDNLSGIYLNYSSDDPKIAKITEEYDDAFVITGKKTGTTTITVSGRGCKKETVDVIVE